MRKRYDKPMTAAEIAATTNRDIDFSDVPDLDDAFWKNARLVEPDRTRSVTLRVKQSVLDVFKARGKGYQTRMNAVLESYVRALKGPRRTRGVPGGQIQVRGLGDSEVISEPKQPKTASNPKGAGRPKGGGGAVADPRRRSVHR